MEFESSEIKPINFKDLRVGDLILVDGYDDNDPIRKKIFKKEIANVIDSQNVEDKIQFLLAFKDWDGGHDGNVEHYESGLCPRENCWWFYGQKNINFYKNNLEVVDIFSSLNENEDGWWDEIVKNIENDPNQKIKINFYQDIFSENIVLNPGDHINIEIYEDGLYINGDATIVRKGEGSDYYLLKLPNIMIFGDDEETTHCGEQQDGKICECIEGGNGFSGKCWWVELSHADSLYLYTKRKGF